MEEVTTFPPPTAAPPVNTINLSSINNSKITAVSVYSDRAEVTRLFKFSVKTGQNHVNINGLPSVLDGESIRLGVEIPKEAVGNVTVGEAPQPDLPPTLVEIPKIQIDDVTVGEMPEAPQPDLLTLAELTERKTCITNGLERLKKVHGALGDFFSSFKIEHIGASRLDQVVEGYESAGGKLDEKIINLEKELKVVEDQIANWGAKREEKITKEEEKRDGANKDKLRSKVSLILRANKESKVELLLTYAVLNATWTAVYDVRVGSIQATKTPVTLVYKAAIAQDTAENWEDVPLTLEAPAFQVGIPTLNEWTLAFVRMKQTARMTRSLGDIHFRDVTVAVTSTGNVSAIFTVPGTITIPSDNAAHNVTITQLELDATMSWIAIPKVDARARLSAKITNSSKCTLLAGVGSIYVDGSFISKSNISATNPSETFDCDLGLDPAIRITYHPMTKKPTQTGSYPTTTTVSTFEQRITVHNTKSIPATNLRIIDQIPVSSNDKITVRLISPALPNVPRNDGSAKGEKKVACAQSDPKAVVVAEWGDGMDDPAAIEDGTAMIGQDGKLSWICGIAEQGKASLELEWKVTAPTRSHVYNL